MKKCLSGERVWAIIESLAETNKDWDFVRKQLLKGDKVSVENMLNHRGKFYASEEAFMEDSDALEEFTELAEWIAED